MNRKPYSLVILLLLSVRLVAAEKFYSDDPLQNEPRPRNAASVKPRKLNDYYDLVENSFKKRGERNTATITIRARDVNTMDEPMDGAWYTHRNYWNSMSDEQLRLGPDGKNPPSETGQWTVVSAKTEGISPGFVMEDSKGVRYYAKFDPVTNPEMATGAEMIVSHLFYALGYHVPDNYLVHFTADKLVLGKDVKFSDDSGHERVMTHEDLNRILANIPKSADGTYRGIVSVQIAGKQVGPFKYFGTRGDDPNDVVLHEHRRELRGLFVFSSWLNHNDSRSINTLDSVIDDSGGAYVRHYLMDFGATLGSGSTIPKTARVGGEYYLDFKPAPLQMGTLGLAVPYWAHAHYPGYPAVGGFEAATFRPDSWVPDYPNPAFRNRLPDDEFWAAKQVVAFTNEQIRALVKLAQYSDPRVEQYIGDTIIARRDKIGRAYLSKTLPLDRFAIENGDLVFHDLAREHGLEAKGSLQVNWSRFDNQSNQKSPIATAQGFHVPESSDSSYLAADIWRGDDKAKSVTVYLRTAGKGPEIVGVERNW